jgi:hypothetical protein
MSGKRTNRSVDSVLEAFAEQIEWEIRRQLPDMTVKDVQMQLRLVQVELKTIRKQASPGSDMLQERAAEARWQ